MPFFGLKQPLILILAGLGTAAAAAEPLRVCADPDNLPFSNRAGDGFDNAIAELIADELGRDGVSHAWLPQRPGQFGAWLDAGACDVVMGVPASTAAVVTTRPYYRSTPGFVTGKDAGHAIESIADPALESIADPELATLAISMAVRRGDVALRAALDDAIVRQADAIRTILESYGVPLVAETEAATFAGIDSLRAPEAPSGLAAD